MKQNKKAIGSWASYQDEKDKSLWRCDVDELAKTIFKNGWGNIPKTLNDKKAMEICILAEAYLKLANKKAIKLPIIILPPCPKTPS